MQYNENKMDNHDLENFKSNGYVCIDKFLDEGQVHWLEGRIDRILNEFGHKSSFMEESVMAYGESWIFCENMLSYDQELASFYLEGPLTQLAALLLETNRVFFLRDQTYYKFNNGEETPWHQDGLFIPSDNLQSITFWVPFHDINSKQSPMSYIRHSNRYCYLGSQFDRYHTYETFRAVEESKGMEIDVFDSMKVGQILAHDGWAMHGSPSMNDGQTRKAIVVVYSKYEITLDSTATMLGCHPNLRAQAQQIRKGNAGSYQSLCKLLSRT